MMGLGHALLGTATWSVAATITMPAFGMEVTPTILIAGAIPIAGAALIPDIDHPNGSIANSGGIITRTIATISQKLSGGHREGTHQLWFFAAVSILAFATTGLIGIWGAIAWYLILSAFGAQALAKTELHQRFNKIWRSNTGIFAKLYCWAFAAVATVFAIWVFGLDDTSRWWWLPWAIVLGHLSHLVGDILTTAGLNLGWGIPKVRLPILGDAGSAREQLFDWLLLAITVFFMGASIFGFNPLSVLSELFDYVSQILKGQGGGGGGFVIK